MVSDPTYPGGRVRPTARGAILIERVRLEANRRRAGAASRTEITQAPSWRRFGAGHGGSSPGTFGHASGQATASMVPSTIREHHYIRAEETAVRRGDQRG